MPKFRFHYIICSFLPGLPLSIIIYWLYLKGHYNLPVGQDDYYFVLYFLIAPLFIGLFIDAIRHFIEDINIFPKIFWKYISLDEIPNIVKDKGKEIIEQYVLTLDKLYPMYEYFWNTWISATCSGIIYLIYLFIIDKNKLDNPAIHFFGVILLIIFLTYFPVALIFVRIQKRLSTKLMSPRLEAEM